MLKETENEETSLFCQIFLLDDISIFLLDDISTFRFSLPPPTLATPIIVTLLLFCDIKILCAFLLVCPCVLVKATLMVLFCMIMLNT